MSAYSLAPTKYSGKGEKETDEHRQAGSCMADCTSRVTHTLTVTAVAAATEPESFNRPMKRRVAAACSFRRMSVETSRRRENKAV